MKGSYKVKLYKRGMITLTNPTPEAHLLSFFSKFSSSSSSSSLSICICFFVGWVFVGFINGKSTLLWQSKREERAMVSWRRCYSQKLCSDSWHWWKLDCFAKESWYFLSFFSLISQFSYHRGKSCTRVVLEKQNYFSNMSLYGKHFPCFQARIFSTCSSQLCSFFNSQQTKGKMEEGFLP